MKRASERRLFDAKGNLHFLRYLTLPNDEDLYCNESSFGSTSNPENLLAVASPPKGTYPTPESATEVAPMQTEPQSRRPRNASHTGVQHDMSMNAAECGTLDGVPEIEPTQSDTSAQIAPTNGVEES